MNPTSETREVTAEELASVEGGAMFLPPPANMAPVLVKLAESQGTLPGLPGRTA